VRLSDGVPQDELVILDGLIGRVRDVAVAPDGAILLLSDEADGGLYRLAEAGQ
jgi:glucose/arabinose dehydrogenase